MQAIYKLEASKPDGTVYRMEFAFGTLSLGWLLMKLMP